MLTLNGFIMFGLGVASMWFYEAQMRDWVGKVLAKVSGWFFKKPPTG